MKLDTRARVAGGSTARAMPPLGLSFRGVRRMARRPEPDAAMRVLHLGKFYPPYRGGIESHLHALMPRADQVDQRQCNCRQRDRADCAKVRSTESKSGDCRGCSIYGRRPFVRPCAREIRGTDADIIHLHLPNPLAALAYLASGHKGRLVITWHSDIVRQKTIARMLAPLDDALLTRASALIASSPNYVDSSPILSRNRDRCRVIPFGIDADSFRPRDAENRRENSPALRPAYRAGRWPDGVLQGLRISDSRDGVVRGHLLLVGEGPLQAKLERQAFDAGATDRITFLGRVSQDEMIGYLPCRRRFRDALDRAQRGIRNRATRSDGLRQTRRQHAARFRRAFRLARWRDRNYGCSGRYR